MRGKGSFFDYHPLVNLAYFLLVLLFSMFLMQPVCLAISFFCAAAYGAWLNGRRALRLGLLYVLPLLLLTMVLSPLFSHEGATILAYFPSGNPLTLESVVYGIASAFLLGSLLQWFSCLNAVMTADKLVYLFGRLIPALSMLLSMALRFVPRFGAQWRAVAAAQRCLGRDISQGSLWKRARCGIKIFSIVVSWALESAVETADSMKSRGYGLPGRTAFSIYRFSERDGLALAFLLGCGVYVLAGQLSGGLAWRYYPTVQGTLGGLYTGSIYLTYFALCVMPLALDLAWARRWRQAEVPG